MRLTVVAAAGVLLLVAACTNQPEVVYIERVESVSGEVASPIPTRAPLTSPTVEALGTLAATVTTKGGAWPTPTAPP